MNSATPHRVISVASPVGSGQWSSPKRKCIESETGLSLLARLETRPSLRELDLLLFPEGPKPGDVIELSGVPGCGKSALSLSLVASAILPRTWKGVQVGGCGSGVIFVDSDIHFNILHLENIMQKKVKIILKKCRSILKGKSSTMEMQEMVENSEELQEFLLSSKQFQNDELNKLSKKCLQNFFYLRCMDSTQFVVTLLSMNDLFQIKSNVSLVVVDSISAFYWYDRSYRAESWYKVEQHYSKVFKVFLSYIKKYKIPLVSTRQALFQKKFKDDNPGKKVNQLEEDETNEAVAEYEFIGKEWSGSVTCRIKLSIAKCPVLGIGFERNGRSVTQQDIANTHLVNSKEKTSIGIPVLGQCPKNIQPSIGKSMYERPTYCAEVTEKERKTRLFFTVHEEGIRWND